MSIEIDRTFRKAALKSWYSNSYSRCHKTYTEENTDWYSLNSFICPFCCAAPSHCVQLNKINVIKDIFCDGPKKVSGLLEGGEGQGRLRGTSHLYHVSERNCIYISPVSGVQWPWSLTVLTVTVSGGTSNVLSCSKIECTGEHRLSSLLGE